jgi:vanillate O-demethylase monooxygenase subunit
VYLQTEMALTGTLQETGIQSPQGHLITPASQNETHYVLSQAIPKALGEWAQGVVAQNITGLDELFPYEDKPMVEAQQRALAGKSFWEMKPVLLDVDAPAVRARRALEQMLATEPAGVATN